MKSSLNHVGGLKQLKNFLLCYLLCSTIEVGVMEKLNLRNTDYFLAVPLAKKFNKFIFVLLPRFYRNLPSEIKIITKKTCSPNTIKAHMYGIS